MNPQGHPQGSANTTPQPAPQPHTHRAPLHRIEQLSPLRRRAKISNKKLPEDFFLLRRQDPVARPQLHTQALPRRSCERERVSETRESSLQRGLCSNTMNLILGIISSGREMKKAMRKHSVEMRKENSESELRLELPPLLLRKGVTAY